MTGEPLYSLTESEAFDAMSLFVNRFADRAGDDLLTLLGDIAQSPSGLTFDPAAWEDWMECVRDVVGQRGAVNDEPE